MASHSEPNTYIELSDRVLYMGDLHRGATEADIRSVFGCAGHIETVTICTHPMTNISKGFGFIKFVESESAKYALENMNHELIRGKPSILMRAQKGSPEKRLPAANVFISNIEKSITSYQFEDTFAQCGEILSCKIVTDESGSSKGFGFVQYADESSARAAIEKVNGMLIKGQKVYVGLHKPRAQKKGERTSFLKQRFQSLNLEEKNLNRRIDDDRLGNEFADHGTIVSAKVMRNGQSISKGYGFVSLENRDSGIGAARETHGRIVEGQARDATVAQSKEERSAFLKEKIQGIMTRSASGTPHLTPHVQLNAGGGFCIPSVNSPTHFGNNSQYPVWSSGNPYQNHLPQQSVVENRLFADQRSRRPGGQYDNRGIACWREFGRPTITCRGDFHGPHQVVAGNHRFQQGSQLYRSGCARKKSASSKQP